MEEFVRRREELKAAGLVASEAWEVAASEFARPKPADSVSRVGNTKYRTAIL